VSTIFIFAAGIYVFCLLTSPLCKGDMRMGGGYYTLPQSPVLSSGQCMLPQMQQQRQAQLENEAV
jgi:hypothetical protein